MEERGREDDVSKSVRRGGEWMSTGIQCFFKQLEAMVHSVTMMTAIEERERTYLVYHIKVLLHCRCRYIAKIFIQYIDEGLHKRKCNKRVACMV